MYIQNFLLFTGDDFTRKVAVVAGWGRKYENGFTDRYLQKTLVEILPDSDCSLSKIGNLFSNIQDQVLCAYQRNTDSCQVPKHNHCICVLLIILFYSISANTVSVTN